MKKTGLVIAATAAVLFLTGCPKKNTDATTIQPAPMASSTIIPADDYKGPNEGKAPCRCKPCKKSRHFKKDKPVSTAANDEHTLSDNA